MAAPIAVYIIDYGMHYNMLCSFDPDEASKIM